MSSARKVASRASVPASSCSTSAEKPVTSTAMIAAIFRSMRGETMTNSSRGHAQGGKPSSFGVEDKSAEGRGLPEADIIEQDDDDIGRAGRTMTSTARAASGCCATSRWSWPTRLADRAHRHPCRITRRYGKRG